MSKRSFLVDGGIHSFNNSLLDGDVVVTGNIILADGSKLLSENLSAKIDFAGMIDMNNHRLMNHAPYQHPYDLATKQVLEDAISSSITDVSQIQLDILTSLNNELNDPAKLLEATTSIDEKIDLATLNTTITNAEAIIQQNIDDAAALEYAELNARKSSAETALATAQTTYTNMDATYQAKLAEFQALANAFSASFNNIVTAAKAYAETRLAGVIAAAPADLDTLGEISTKFQTVSNNIDTNLTNQINSKASTTYVNNQLARKASDANALKWNTTLGLDNKIYYPEAVLTLNHVTANSFVGDGSKLTGLAAAGVFSAAWDRIVSLQNRLLRVQAIVGFAQSYSSVLPIRTIDNPALAGTSKFGNAVALSGTTVVIGAYNHDDENATYSGRAYIADRTTGAMKPVFNPVPSSNVKFGNSVAINKTGDIALIGAQGQDGQNTDDGKVYFVDTATGTIIKTVSNPVSHTGDAFGFSVALTDDYAVVGSKYFDTTTIDAGSAFVLKGNDSINTIGEVQKQYPNPDEIGQRYHGAAVAISNVYAAVGAPGFVDGTNVYRGMVSMYDVSTSETNPEWTVENPNTIGTTQVDDKFGSAVDISPKYVIVGAPADWDAAGDHADSGTVYVLKREDGQVLYTFANPNDNSTAAADRFGFSVAVDGEILVVGAPGETAFGTTTQTGVVYIYNLNNGELMFTIRNPNTDEVAQFGYSVDIDATTIAIGAPDTNASQGRIYIYNLA